MSPKASCISSIFSPCIKKNEPQIYLKEKNVLSERKS